MIWLMVVVNCFVTWLSAAILISPNPPLILKAGVVWLVINAWERVPGLFK